MTSFCFVFNLKWIWFQCLLLIRDLSLHIFSWWLNFNLVFETLKTSPVGIQLHGLPVEYWSRQGVLGIMNALGRPLKIDECSLKMEQNRSVRVCVRLISPSLCCRACGLGTRKPASFSIREPSYCVLLVWACRTSSERMFLVSIGWDMAVEERSDVKEIPPAPTWSPRGRVT